MLTKTTCKDDILKIFKNLEQCYLGKSPGLPYYYTEDDIPPILETHAQLMKFPKPILDFDIEMRYKTSASLEEKLYRKLDVNNKTDQVCNDWFGACIMVDSFNDIPFETLIDNFPVEFTQQANNGYIAIHAYLYDSYKMPIEVQFQTKYDYKFNCYNRKYNYKKVGMFGWELRDLYNKGFIRSEEDYVKFLNQFILLLTYRKDTYVHH